MNEDFLKILQIEYTELKQGFEKASIEGKGTPQEIADRREELVKAFLKKYFPFPYIVTKGNIVDSYNKRSASIDCVILDPSHPHTIDAKNNKASIILADGVDFAIEIKGELCDKNEIIRALNQIKSVKELTRVRSGIILKKYKNDYVYKIPTVLIANKTYADITMLIETILNYYKENKIKRAFQFDIILADNYTIINSCKGQISFNNTTGIFFENTGDNSLAVLLFLLSNMPLVQPLMNENIYNIYLKDIFNAANYREDWNNILKEIENN